MSEYVDEIIKNVVIYKQEMLANVQKRVSDTTLPIASEYVDETIRFMLFYKHKTLANFQNWVSAALSRNFDIFANPGTFTDTSEVWNFMGSAVQHSDEAVARGGNALAATSGDPNALPGLAETAPSLSGGSRVRDRLPLACVVFLYQKHFWKKARALILMRTSY